MDRRTTSTIFPTATARLRCTPTIFNRASRRGWSRIIAGWTSFRPRPTTAQSSTRRSTRSISSIPRREPIGAFRYRLPRICRRCARTGFPPRVKSKMRQSRRPACARYSRRTATSSPSRGAWRHSQPHANAGRRRARPTWSPDGRWIAYFSDASGEYTSAPEGSEGARSVAHDPARTLSDRSTTRRRGRRTARRSPTAISISACTTSISRRSTRRRSSSDRSAYEEFSRQPSRCVVVAGQPVHCVLRGRPELPTRDLRVRLARGAQRIR